jgi:hypothetical protein
LGRLRAGLLGVAAAGAFGCAVATPAHAHAGLVLTVDHDGRGNVAVQAVWADGHPVTEPLAATMTAVSAAGGRVGPVALSRLPGEPTVVYPGTLKPGSWQVTVDLAVPGIGHCTAPVTVASTSAAAKPTSTRCGETAPAASAGTASAVAAAAAPAAGADHRPLWALFAVAGLITAVTAAAIAVRNRTAR